MRYKFRTSGVCAQQIEFDLIDGKISNVSFYGGCNGNLKAISILVEGMEPDEISEKLLGNICGSKTTSCADQLAKAVMAAKAQEQNA